MIGMFHGVRVHVAKEGEQITAPNGDKLIVSKGSAVASPTALWMVQSDFDALLASDELKDIIT